tara:strand:- start:56 stop:178 length:123 start_codon:yes stop_codon:yes gene_type:complete
LVRKKKYIIEYDVYCFDFRKKESMHFAFDASIFVFIFKKN